MKFFSPLIFLALAVGLFFWYIEPAWAGIGSTQATISQYQQALAKANTAVATKNTLVNQYNSFTPTQLGQLSVFLPRQIDPIDFILEVNAVAAQYGPGLKTISVTSDASSNGGAPATTPYSTISLSATVSMTYPNFLLFLKDLERSLPPSDIIQLTFTAPSTGSVYTFNFTVQTYYMP